MLRWGVATAEAYNACADGKTLLIMAATPPAGAMGAPSGSKP